MRAVRASDDSPDWRPRLAALCRYGLREARDRVLRADLHRTLAHLDGLEPTECRIICESLTERLAELGAVH